MKSLRLVLIVASLAWLVPSQAKGTPPVYHLSDIGPAGLTCQSVSINAQGWVDIICTDANDVGHLYVYSNGNLTAFDGSPTGVGVSQMNASGAIAGWVMIAPGIAHATLQPPVGPAFDLGTLGGDQSEAFGINDAGVLVGNSTLADGSSLAAFVYRDGKMLNLGNLGYPYASANAINQRGEITGYSLTPQNEAHPFIFHHGVMQDLGRPLGGPTGIGYAINDHGHVTGVATISENDIQEHGFVFNGAEMVDLGLMGGLTMRPTSINNKDQVVGYVGTAQRPVPQAFGFLASGRHEYVLDDLLDSTTNGLHILSGSSINDLGMIAAVAVDRAGNQHAVLLTPVTE